MVVSEVGSRRPEHGAARKGAATGEWLIPHSSFLRRSFLAAPHTRARMRATRGSILASGFSPALRVERRGWRGKFPPGPPAHSQCPAAFSPPSPSGFRRLALMGSRLQLQQRNCLRISRSSVHRITIVKLAKNCADLVARGANAASVLSDFHRSVPGKPLESAATAGENAGGGDRTHTPLREPDFESGASASSATPACRGAQTRSRDRAWQAPRGKVRAAAYSGAVAGMASSCLTAVAASVAPSGL